MSLLRGFPSLFLRTRKARLEWNITTGPLALVWFLYSTEKADGSYG
jgi:hypothetical protein